MSSEAVKNIDVKRVQKANKTKARIKKICAQMDDLRSGLLDPDVFFQVLKLNKIQLSEADIKFLKGRTEQNVNGSQKILYKDAVKWIVIDLTQSVDKWIIRTNESLLASVRDSMSSWMSVLSGLSDLSDVSGITELKAQLKANKEKQGLIKIDENEELAPV